MHLLPHPVLQNLKGLNIKLKTRPFYNPLIDIDAHGSLIYYPRYTAAKYSLLSLGSGFMDFSPGFHPAGQTSSGLSCTYCKACKTNAHKEATNYENDRKEKEANK